MKTSLHLIIISLILFFIGCGKHENLQTTIIKANTIVCDECAKTIKKAVYDLEGVKEVNVDLDEKTVEVKFIPLQTNVETIEITITRAGYDANDRKRDTEAYDNLPDCCKHLN